MKSRITGRVEEWWKEVCQKHQCEYYMRQDYPLCSYCTCPDNCIVINKGDKGDKAESEIRNDC